MSTKLCFFVSVRAARNVSLSGGAGVRAHTLLNGNVASCENKSIHGLLTDLNAKVDRIEATIGGAPAPAAPAAKDETPWMRWGREDEGCPWTE